jgi:hypothetical protein
MMNQRTLTFLRDYSPIGPRARPHKGDVLAFLRSLWVIGVVKPGRLEYWKFLCRSWVSHRRALAEAVELAIRGYHFRVVAARL